MKITKTLLARHLRQEQTPAEKALWDLLRNRQFENLKFRRQHPLKDYIVDFYCHELKLIIELDGAHHNEKEQKYNDEQRDFHLRFLGYKVLRYKNDIIFNNLQAVFQDIKDIKNKLPSQRERARVREKIILSTKKLTASQKKKFQDVNISVVDYNAISIKLLDFEIPQSLENAIFTSQNAVKSFFRDKNRIIKKGFKSFCVGNKTKHLLEEYGQNVIKKTENASELAKFIVKRHKNDAFHYFCGNLRRDEIPSVLKNKKIALFEVKTYETVLKPLKFDQKGDGILFFSPSGVESFTLENEVGNSLAICIGKTTASEAKKHTNKVVISKNTTVESVIEEVVRVLK